MKTFKLRLYFETINPNFVRGTKAYQTAFNNYLIKLGSYKNLLIKTMTTKEVLK